MPLPRFLAKAFLNRFARASLTRRSYLNRRPIIVGDSTPCWQPNGCCFTVQSAHLQAFRQVVRKARLARAVEVCKTAKTPKIDSFRTKQWPNKHYKPYILTSAVGEVAIRCVVRRWQVVSSFDFRGQFACQSFQPNDSAKARSTCATSATGVVPVGNRDGIVVSGIDGTSGNSIPLPIGSRRRTDHRFKC